LAPVRYGAMQGKLLAVPQGILASHKDLERLEDAAGLRGLLAGVADQYLGALPDQPQPLKQRGMERKGEQTLRRLQSPEGAEAAVVHPTPRALEFLARGLPLMELPLSDLAPALETSHWSLLLMQPLCEGTLF